MQLFQLFDQKWKPIHLLLAKNQKIINSLAMIVETILLLVIPTGYYVNVSKIINYGLFYELAGKFGTISFLLYLATHLPGILKRFQLFPIFNASITLYRRHIGILMFVFAIAHSSLVSAIPMLQFYKGVYLWAFDLTSIYGLIGLGILCPLWLTSNDFSQQKLGRFWKMLQRLTYLALFFIYLHVVLVEMSLAIAGGVVFSLVAMSWVNQWLVNKQSR